MIINNYQPRLLTISSTTINGGESTNINVIPVPLRRDDILSPWCYAASLSPIIDDDDSTTTSTKTLPTGSNFLATQVWPSSRIASTVIEKYMNPSWSVCELGCGPGLPSLTAACCGARKVIATDLDTLALELVKAAAIEQGYIRQEDSDNVTKDAIKTNQQFITKGFDLTSKDDILPKADLYILSDVFESSSVAEGAAYHVKSILSNNKQRTKEQVSRVWVFAQQDRAQRDAFLNQMREWYCNEDKVIDWSMNHKPDPNEELWLFDLDETMVGYN